MADKKLMALFVAGGALVLYSVARGKVRLATHVDPSVYPHTQNKVTQLLQHHNASGAYWLGPVQGNGVVDPKHKHGSRATFIYVPQHFNALAPYELIYFFHGLTGFFKTPGGNMAHRVSKNLAEMDKDKRNYVLVFPELPWSYHTTTPNGRQRAVFNNSAQEDFRTFYPETRRILKEHFQIKPNPSKIKLIGHSAGGSALRAISTAGMMDAIKPDSVLFSDSTYGTWLDEFYRDYQDSSGTKIFLFNVVDPSPTKPYKQTQRFFRARGGKPQNIEVVELRYGDNWSHKKIGDSILPMSAKY